MTDTRDEALDEITDLALELWHQRNRVRRMFAEVRRTPPPSSEMFDDRAVVRHDLAKIERREPDARTEEDPE